MPQMLLVVLAGLVAAVVVMVAVVPVHLDKVTLPVLVLMQTLAAAAVLEQ
jgi:hypothetical protein